MEEGGMRDAYGFAVSKEYEELYKNYSALYQYEEHDRCRHWNELLERHQPGAGISQDEAVLEAALEQIFVIAADNAELENHLKLLIQAGIPLPYRGTVWKLLLDVKARRVEGEYEELVRTALGPDAFTSPHAAPGTEQPASSRSKATGVRTWAPPSKDWLAQIEKDLHRTFPGHWMMDEEGGRPGRGAGAPRPATWQLGCVRLHPCTCAGHQPPPHHGPLPSPSPPAPPPAGKGALRRVLAAYSVYNPSVGYCQGMNFVTGCLLLFLQEEDAFVSLAALVDEVLPGYYSIAMVQPQVREGGGKGVGGALGGRGGAAALGCLPGRAACTS
jgi:hypothetical protein